ncbi:MFS transporter [Streptantibioticus cattleyicolor]|uniref:EmrB/QacA family drug resistance transporter n=1 Tax=Streptantibioticus cattleyicolor (strain ATCC 35852 / DSM 46488 / JCM 4925 / NBRC 14057 / NRRL 8057) TaxID=1003195 RepID=F8JN75_STREN|nr:MFS transporter [Streptantibioticus cattleyicolor]AEW99172.1 EmrB/QacA family drug resistance transporter [Streptantibioticus cattleyicolor NRRL 8057 = DSM 46488]CCB71786.1 Efflux membrane protein [Streptantibioticus cattleyicolor NRRL 8057 = DSM 46488]
MSAEPVVTAGGGQGAGGGRVPSPAALSPARKRLVLAIACMSTFLVNLDNTIVNVALPDIRTQLRPGVAGLQWIVDSYLLTLASLLILSGSLGDRFGRRRVFGTGLVAFAAGSLLSSLAPSTGWLVAFRVVQAVGASMLNPVGMSIIGNVFPQPQARARAFGVWGAAVGLGMASGPVLGGVLVQACGWRSVFWAGIPVALAVAVCARLFVPESRSPARGGPDLAGQGLVLVLLAGVVFTIIEVPRAGLWSPRTVLGAVPAVLAAVALGPVERRRRDPLIDFRFFRSVPFTTSMVIAVLTYAAIGGFLFLNTLYLQDVRGYSPSRAGLYTLPMAVGTAVGAQLSGRLVRSRGAVVALVAAGLCVSGAALLTMAVVGTRSSVPLLTGYALLGLGFGGANTPVNNTAMAGMPRSRAGVAGAVASSSRQVGQSLGVAVFGAIVAAGAGGDLAAGFARASVPGWLLITGIGVAITVLGAVASSAAAQRSARRTAAGFEEP